ncbi:MAG: hypothetical protein K5829_14925 [Treponema sp.]|nr:hypothetical protein [Treponema sp.]
MKLFYKNKIEEKKERFCEIDYSVLDYEQLLMVNGAGGKSGGSTSSGPSSSSSQQTPTQDSPKNKIDNTYNKKIMDDFTGSGYELLSDKKDNTYTDGSRKEYMQSQFEILKSDTDSYSVIKKEERYPGVRGDPNHSYNDYDHYQIIGKDGKLYMDAIDINRDGKIDYVK